MRCPSDKCASTNVQHLPNYWASLPSDSSLKKDLAEPAAVQGQYLLVLAVVGLGVYGIASGTVAGGLLILLVAGGWGAAMHRKVEESEAARASWAQELICLACTGRFCP
jgi:hypothetical protein